MEGKHCLLLGMGTRAHVVYQFALALLTLYAFISGDPVPLRRWLAALSPPPKGCAFLNFLASHDGIGVSGGKAGSARRSLRRSWSILIARGLCEHAGPSKGAQRRLMN